MRVALLGHGKTGSEVVKLLPSAPTIFNSKKRIDADSLAGHDVIISFLPGPVFLEVIPLLIQLKIPVVTGSTGTIWPKDLSQDLKNRKLKWIYASNFSLGMNIVHAMINQLQKTKKVFTNYQISLHEEHHTEKVDAPSGTALSWKKWLNQESSIKITSKREGDIVGLHQLNLETSFEKITLTHEVKRRAVFAEGAIWAAHKILNDQDLPYGLNDFQDITLKELL